MATPFHAAETHAHAGLAAQGLNHAYGARATLRDVSFSEPPKGALTALIGPNAAGKSTLFRVLAGLVTPQQGRVTLDGIDLSTLGARARLRRICFMPQFFCCNAALTVFDVVLMARKELKGWRVTSEDRAAVGAALEAAGVAHLAEAHLGELSGGQAQMVSACQALIRRAEVYLFDEPTSALDLRHQLQLLERMRAAMRARNATGIVALHDLNLAARFADHLILIGGGRILAEGHPSRVLRQPVVGATYGVELDVFHGPRENLHVSACL